MQATILKLSARAQARTLIIEKVLSGDLQPGIRLNESALAREFGVSQTPIREALLGLEGQGYVTSHTDRGFFVKPLDAQEVREIYPLLARLEAMALSSINTFSAKTINALSKLNREFSECSGEEAIELDNQWHRQLLSECTNQYLLDNIERVRNDAHRYENLFFREGGHIHDSATQHHQILTHLKRWKHFESLQSA